MAAAWAVFLREPEVTYEGKTLSEWFYAGRTNMFHRTVMDEARRTFLAVEAEAVPFLVSNLDRRWSLTGNALYFKLYESAPNPVQNRLPVPISMDDVHFMSLRYLWSMKPLPDEWLPVLAEKIPRLPNPSLRDQGLRLLCFGNTLAREESAIHTAAIDLCRTLLHDESEGVRLRAAIELSKLDPRDTNGLHILRVALADKNRLSSIVDVTYCRSGQPPGMSSGRSPVHGRLIQYLQTSIEVAVKRVERHIKPTDPQPSPDEAGVFPLL
jgi:hypothetical protein